MRTYVINMHTRPDRLAGFRIEAERAGITDYTVFDAITPRNVKVPKSFILTAGSYCNGLSHKAIWQELVDGSDEYALIFEDDAVWTGRDLDDADIIDIHRIDMLFLGGNHTAYGAIEGTHVKGNIYRCGHTLTGHAYMIHRDTAQLLLSTHDFTRTAIDAGWKTIHDLGHSYYASPSVWVQRAGYSDIWRRDVDYSHCIR